MSKNKKPKIKKKPKNLRTIIDIRKNSNPIIIRRITYWHKKSWFIDLLDGIFILCGIIPFIIFYFLFSSNEQVNGSEWKTKKDLKQWKDDDFIFLDENFIETIDYEFKLSVENWELDLKEITKQLNLTIDEVNFIRKTLDPNLKIVEETAYIISSLRTSIYGIWMYNTINNFY